MKRRFPVVGVLLILVGAGGLAWLSTFLDGPWWGWQGRTGRWGAGGAFMGPGMMPGVSPGMMGTEIPADIRYNVLTGKEHEEARGEEEMEHPPYTDVMIKRAITQGLDPAGKPLVWTMPRWRMDHADVADLLAYLKTLR